MVRITRQEYENPDAVEGLPENIIQAINMWRAVRVVSPRRLMMQ